MFDGASVDGIGREISKGSETEINRRVPLTRDRDLNPFKNTLLIATLHVMTGSKVYD